jgi:hypothetical protein
VLEQPKVTLWRAHEDRHLVEPDAATRFVQDPARDLHTLAPSPGAEKNSSEPSVHSLGRLDIGLEEEAAQGREIIRAALVAPLCGASHLDERVGRSRDRLAGPSPARRTAAWVNADTRAASAASLHGDVEQQHGTVIRMLPQQPRGGVQEIGPISGGDLGKRLVEAREEIRKIGRARPMARARHLDPIPASRSSCSVRASARESPAIRRRG